jgi:hypothetical protein
VLQHRTPARAKLASNQAPRTGAGNLRYLARRRGRHDEQQLSSSASGAKTVHAIHGRQTAFRRVVTRTTELIDTVIWTVTSLHRRSEKRELGQRLRPADHAPGT